MVDFSDFTKTIVRNGRGGAAKRFTPGEVRGRIYFASEKGKTRRGYVTLYVSIDKQIADFTKLYRPRFSPKNDRAILIAPDDKGWKFTTSSKEALSAKVRFDFLITELPATLLVALKMSEKNIIFLNGEYIDGYYLLTLKED